MTREQAYRHLDRLARIGARPTMTNSRFYRLSVLINQHLGMMEKLGFIPKAANYDQRRWRVA